MFTVNTHVRRWCQLINTLVHVFMYYYFAIAALGKTVWWKKHLTAGQLVQFVSINSLLFWWWQQTLVNPRLQ